MKTIKEVLMERDGMSLEQAEKEIEEARTKLFEKFNKENNNAIA